jgi:purine-nucleoside/S-methyl-5'-thioadenosine phosphorylase / adenosine deaminase
MAYNILKNKLFKHCDLIFGVTQKNQDIFPPFGFSISNADIYNDEEIATQRRYFADYLGVEFDKMKFQKQVHGNRIRIIDENSEQEDSDGMMTNIKGIVLNVTIADCGGILIYDPKNEAIAALHSGWRGTQQNIANKGIKMMQNEYGSRPNDLLVYLSPCASGEKYEVGWDVAKYFPDSIKQISSEKYLFDNKHEIFNQLLAVGVAEDNIEISDICTISDTNYHSYRRDKEKSGRMSAFIGMKI